MHKIKVGILTFCHSVNYGAYLQSYALCSRLNQEAEIQAELIDYKMVIEQDFYLKFIRWSKNIFRVIHNRKRYKTFLKASQKLVLSKERLVSDDLNEFKNMFTDTYNIIIAGSDEIWKIDGIRGFPTPYFLPDQYGAVKVAYAVSGRTPFGKLLPEQQLLLKKYLEDFTYIGLRDKKTVQEVTGIVQNGSKIFENFDPTFSYNFKPDRKRGKKILKERYGISENSLCIGIMYSEYRKSKPNLLKYMKHILGNEVQFISLYEWEPGLKNTPDLEPLDWVDVIAALDAMVTMYFHAVCFSIISGTPFFAIEGRAQKNEESKIYDLLEKFDCLECYSLGLQTAIANGNLRLFLKNITRNHRIDFSSKLDIIRKEFEEFVQVIKENCMYADK